MAGRTFSASSRGTLTRTVSPLASELMTRTYSQRSLEADVVALSEPDWPALGGPDVDCARVPSGKRRRAVPAMRVVLTNKVLERSSMRGHLLAGAGPVLGDRYESAPNTVSWFVRYHPNRAARR